MNVTVWEWRPCFLNNRHVQEKLVFQRLEERRFQKGRGGKFGERDATQGRGPEELQLGRRGARGHLVAIDSATERHFELDHGLRRICTRDARWEADNVRG